MVLPVIEDGCVIVEGQKILQVGTYRDLRPQHVDYEIDGLLMPGLINAHTHLELSDFSPPRDRLTFVDWVLYLRRQTKSHQADHLQTIIQNGVRRGIAESLRFGITCVGDIAQYPNWVRPVLSAGPIRSVSFGECLGLGPRECRFDDLLSQALDQKNRSVRMAVGVSPHAPYTVDERGYKKVAALTGYPVCTHLAELEDESAFVSDRSGRLRDLYDRLGIDPGMVKTGVSEGVIEWVLRRSGPGWLLVHVNYCSDTDIALIKRSQASVVWCPRTHDYFGHPPHRWRQMTDAGISVAVGTDSLLSSPDLNVVEDLRFLYAQNPQIEPQVLWSCVTVQADRALQWGKHIRSSSTVSTNTGLGRIEPGAMADLIAFPTRSHDPLREILENPTLYPKQVWIGGTLTTV
ncbi:MAG: chlorohydrolase [Phycisphaerae bacterium]|jgi:cytosine/adenosine deaminase-related metal-dependent hydrolase|nr:MAG: chlorohydrolase [Phycisphaerae bacterium]